MIVPFLNLAFLAPGEFVECGSQVYRVASTQCRKAEQRWLLGLVPTLQHHLRTVPGRGGKRDNRTSFFASLLVGMMGDALNESPRRYGLVPIADSPDRPGVGLQGVGSQLIDGEGEGAVEHIAGPERVDRLDRKHRHFAHRLSLAPSPVGSSQPLSADMITRE